MDEYFAHLQKIRWDEEFTYQDIKGADFDIFNDFLKSGCTLKQAIRGAYYYHLQHEMDENGMAKAVHIIAGMLFFITIAIICSATNAVFFCYITCY